MAELLREVAARYRDQLREKTQGRGGLAVQTPPACENCQGVGFVSLGEFEIGDPRFGKIKPCPRCNPRRVSAPDRFGMLHTDYDLCWRDLVAVPGSNALAALRAVRGVVEAGCGGVYLWGPYGVAKTAILKIATAEWLRTGRFGAYLLFSDLLDEIRAGFGGEAQASAYERLQTWGGYAFLALDELDKARATEFAQETQFRLLDRRYERVTRAWESVTLIASNEPPSSLPPALRSRLSDPRFMTVIELTGRDVRPIADKLPMRQAVAQQAVLRHPSTGEVLEVY